MKIEKENLFLFIVIIIGIAVRLIKFDDINLVNDTVVYSRLGKNLIENGRYFFGENYNTGIFFPPGYPVFIGLTNLLFDDLFLSAKLVSFLSSIGSIFISYFIAKELYNKEAGLFAALLFAVYPVLIIISVQGYADAPFIFFLLLSLYLFIKYIDNESILFHALLGFIFGVTCLIRPEALFLLLLPGMRVFSTFDSPLRFNAGYLTRFIVLSLVFVMTLSPYMIFIKNYTGKFMLSGKSNISILLGELSGDRNYHQIVNAPDNVYDRAAFSLDESRSQLVGWSRNINKSLKEYILRDPLEFARKYQKNLIQEIQIFIKLVIPFLLPFFFSFFSRELITNKKRLIFIMLPLILFFMYPTFIIIEKQTLLVIVFLMLFASGGFANAQRVISDAGNYYGIDRSMALWIAERYIRYIMIVVLAVATLSYLKYSRFEHFDPAYAKPEEHKRAGHFLKERLSPGYETLNIMSKFPYVSFYTDSRYTMIPYADIPGVINFARMYDVDYIVVDERALSKWDYFNELLHMDKQYPEVELVYEDATEKLIKLFKIK
jgi:4-amino-4-deoxy-L-arabinose transferase-like glycosyltransferase